jgi:hypothetical protein
MVVDGVQVVLVAGGEGDGDVDELQADHTHVITHRRIASLELIVSATPSVAKSLSLFRLLCRVFAPAFVQFLTPKTRCRIQSPSRRLDQPDAGLRSADSRQMVGSVTVCCERSPSRRPPAIEKD